MYFMVERGDSITKFVGNDEYGMHPCTGGHIYDSQNMPLKAHVGSTVIPDAVLREKASRYPEIRIFENPEDVALAKYAHKKIHEGIISPFSSWKGLRQEVEAYLKTQGLSVKDIMPEKSTHSGKKGVNNGKTDVQDTGGSDQVS